MLGMVILMFRNCLSLFTLHFSFVTLHNVFRIPNKTLKQNGKYNESTCKLRICIVLDSVKAKCQYRH